MSRTIQDIVTDFEHATALVLGDVMMDVYLFGKTERISPEAPVPIVELEREELRLGGAANVARNLKALGANVLLCTIVGDDSESYELEGIMEEAGLSSKYLKRSPTRITTKKTRVLSRNQQMMRFDHEHTNYLNEWETEQVLEKFKNALQKEPDVVILQDYNKGVLTPKVIETVIGWCRERGIPVAVDPKKANFNAYSGATLFKPNLKELREALSVDVSPTDLLSLKVAADMVNGHLDNAYTLVTMADKGVYMTDHDTHVHIPAMVRNIADVSGAGDTVISVAALAMALGADMEQIARLANLAGGMACETVGVAPLNKEKFVQEAVERLT